MAETKPVIRKADMLPAPVIALVQSLVPDCGALLPADITTEQFRAALWLELTGRQSLHDCYPLSLRECVVKAATYGMLPGRDCHFVPFQDKKAKEKKATFVPNYFGVLRAIYRTGMVEQAFAEVVFTNDVYDLDYGRTPMLIHKPPRKNRGVGEGAYGFIQVKGSSRPLIHYMDPDDLDRVRRRAPAHDQGPWVSDLNEMKRKTVMKNVAKYAQLTPILHELLEQDDLRELEDIPEDRHQQNIIDLFGDTHGSPNAPSGTRDTGKVETSSHDTDTEPARETEPLVVAPRAQKTPSPDEPAWKLTLRAHRDTIAHMAVSGIESEENRARLDDLLDSMDFALSPLGTTTDAQGHGLADAVLQWVDMAKEG